MYWAIRRRNRLIEEWLKCSIDLYDAFANISTSKSLWFAKLATISLTERKNRDVESETAVNIANLNDLIMTENITVTSTNRTFFFILIATTSSQLKFTDICLRWLNCIEIWQSLNCIFFLSSHMTMSFSSWFNSFMFNITSISMFLNTYAWTFNNLTTSFVTTKYIKRFNCRLTTFSSAISLTIIEKQLRSRFQKLFCDKSDSSMKLTSESVSMHIDVSSSMLSNRRFWIVTYSRFDEKDLIMTTCNAACFIQLMYRLRFMNCCERIFTLWMSNMWLFRYDKSS